MAALEVENLCYSVAGTPLLDALSFSANAGHLVAVVGPNGAGKTTLLRAVSGLLVADGAVRVDGEPLGAMSRKTRARRLAFVRADDVGMQALTVREIVAEGRYTHRRHVLDNAPTHERVIDRSLERTGLDGFAHRRLSTLSSGERRRVWIALGLAQEADILLLDEPTANLDLYHAQQTLRTLRGLADDGHTVIAALHDLNEAAQFADEVALVNRARLVAFGTPQAVLTPDCVTRYYGVGVDVVTAADGKLRIFACA